MTLDDEVEALLRIHYRWWRFSVSRQHLKLGPVSFGWWRSALAPRTFGFCAVWNGRHTREWTWSR